MSLLLLIKEDQLDARKAREKDIARVLTTLYSEAAMIGKDDGGRKTTDNEVVAVIQKFIKGIDELLDNLSTEDRRFGELSDERLLLKRYLPLQLTDIELTEVIEEIVNTIDNTTMKDMGKIMGALKKEHEGTYNGKIASQIVKRLLT